MQTGFSLTILRIGISIIMCVYVCACLCLSTTYLYVHAILSGDGITLLGVMKKGHIHPNQWSAVTGHHLSAHYGHQAVK